MNKINAYFESYEDLEVHKLMLEDDARNKAYKQAIVDNASNIKGKIVMDVGAGTGILSVFCAQAGAAKVYAVEASETYKLAEAIAKENGFASVIEVFHCRVEDLRLPDDVKVDVLVSEWMGFYLLHEGMLDSVIVARDKFLKEDGLIFPESATIYAAPCTFPQFFANWHSVEGVSMNAFAKELRNNASDKPQTVLIEADNILAIPEVVFWCDLRSIAQEELDDIQLEHIFVADKEGIFQGVSLWFTCTFPAYGNVEPVTLSTDPDDEPTHWKQTTLVLPKEIQVEKDEPLALALRLSRSEMNLRHYNIEMTMLNPQVIKHPEYCLCYMTKCILSRVMIKKYEQVANGQ